MGCKISEYRVSPSRYPVEVCEAARLLDMQCLVAEVQAGPTGALKPFFATVM